MKSMIEGATAPPCRRWPVAVESLMDMLATWEACSAPDPLEVPVAVRARRRRELAVLRQDEHGGAVTRARDRRHKRARRDRARLERIVLGARLAGAAA